MLKTLKSAKPNVVATWHVYGLLLILTLTHAYLNIFEI